MHLHVPAEAVADPGDESWGELSSFLDIARRVVAKQALAIEKHMPADALPPVSLYRGLAAHGELCCEGPGVAPQSGSMMSLWPACPDIKESPANRTSATMRTGISEPMGGWGGWCRVFRRQISGTQPACPHPLEWRFSGVGAESLRVRPPGALV